MLCFFAVWLPHFEMRVRASKFAMCSRESWWSSTHDWPIYAHTHVYRLPLFKMWLPHFKDDGTCFQKYDVQQRVLVEQYTV